MQTYRVRPGDRLSAIAALHGVPAQAIVVANTHKQLARLPSGATVFASLAAGEELAIPGTLGIAVLPDQGSCRANGHMAVVPPNLILECICNDGYTEDATTGICMPDAPKSTTPPVQPQPSQPSQPPQPPQPQPDPPPLSDLPPEPEEAQPTSPWPWVAGGVAILALVGGAYALGRGQTPARPARRPTMALARA